MRNSVTPDAWFRGPLRERVKQALLGPTLAGTGIFNMRFLQDMVEQHQSGRRDYTAPIYTVMMFEAFLRNCLEDTPAQPVGLRQALGAEQGADLVGLAAQADEEHGGEANEQDHGAAGAARTPRRTW